MAREAKTARKRPVRSSVAMGGRRDVLNVEGKDDDFVYRIVNDVPGRVAEMKERGYEMAEGEESFSSTLDEAGSAGSVKTKHVGGGVDAVLMRIPKDWYEEDQKAKQDYVNRLEKKTQSNDIKGGYGKVTIE